MIDEVRVYHRALDANELARHASAESAPIDPEGSGPVFRVSFDQDDARDLSGFGNHGVLAGAKPVHGRKGGGMSFIGTAAPSSLSLVDRLWTRDTPFYVRAMVLADDRLFIAGPPDLIDEEDTFDRIMKGDPSVTTELAAQEKALSGEAGGLMHAVSARDGEVLGQYRLPAPPVWNGMAAVHNRIYISTTQGAVICLAGE